LTHPRFQPLFCWTTAFWNKVQTRYRLIRLKRLLKKSPPQYDYALSERRRWAACKLATYLPKILGIADIPYVLHAVPSWLVEYTSVESPIPAPLDLIVLDPALIFCFAPHTDAPIIQGSPQEIYYDNEPGYSSDIPGQDRLTTENLFIRRLMFSEDGVPLIPIFCDPDAILSALTPNALAYLLNTAFHDSAVWCLQNMPPIPLNIANLGAAQSAPGTWVSRRQALEEMLTSALFPITIPGEISIETEDDLS
jgi:hypothetical protein